MSASLPEMNMSFSCEAKGGAVCVGLILSRDMCRGYLQVYSFKLKVTELQEVGGDE